MPGPGRRITDLVPGHEPEPITPEHRPCPLRPRGIHGRGVGSGDRAGGANRMLPL